MAGESLHLRTNGPDETRACATALGRVLCDGDFVALSGDLGAGKTLFSQGVGAGLGVAEPMTSPTFNIVFEYSSGRIPLYHFDLYRLEDAFELEDVDFHSLADAGTPGASLVEWADLFADELPDDRLEVTIRHASGAEGLRDLEATATGPRAARTLEAWRNAIPA